MCKDTVGNVVVEWVGIAVAGPDVCLFQVLQVFTTGLPQNPDMGATRDLPSENLDDLTCAVYSWSYGVMYSDCPGTALRPAQPIECKSSCTPQPRGTSSPGRCSRQPMRSGQKGAPSTTQRDAQGASMLITQEAPLDCTGCGAGWRNFSNTQERACSQASSTLIVMR
jgi:hypothetical protein